MWWLWTCDSLGDLNLSALRGLKSYWFALSAITLSWTFWLVYNSPNTSDAEIWLVKLSPQIINRSSGAYGSAHTVWFDTYTQCNGSWLGFWHIILLGFAVLWSYSPIVVTNGPSHNLMWRRLKAVMPVDPSNNRPLNGEWPDLSIGLPHDIQETRSVICMASEKGLGIPILWLSNHEFWISVKSTNPWSLKVEQLSKMPYYFGF